MIYGDTVPIKIAAAFFFFVTLQKWKRWSGEISKRTLAAEPVLKKKNKTG